MSLPLLRVRVCRSRKGRGLLGRETERQRDGERRRMDGWMVCFATEGMGVMKVVAVVIIEVGGG